MIRVGAINFTNAYPFFYALLNQIIPNSACIYSGTPAEVNEMLKSGHVDVGLISSAAFLNNRFSYILLSDMGVATSKKSISVRLFFKGERPDLDGNPVYVPSLSATSTRLLRVLCRYFWKVSPSFQNYDGPPDRLFRQDVPFLVIGDECLKQIDNSEYSSIDLAQAWHELSNKSFVFSVIATRNDAFKRNPYGIIEFHRLLESAFTWSTENRALLAQKAAQETGCSVSEMSVYFKTLEYQLTSKHFSGLDYFSTLDET